MEWQTVERKISHQTPLNVDELDWAFDVYESRCSYWVASKILAHRKGEDTYPAEEQLKEITRDIDYLFSERKRLTIHGYRGTA